MEVGTTRRTSNRLRTERLTRNSSDSDLPTIRALDKIKSIRMLGNLA
jgi:hypothetical protein